MRTLADELKRDGIRIFSEVACRPETRPPTPPDVTARNETGQLVGFEVSEILSKQALEENVLRRQELRNRLWDAATGVERHRSRESGRGIEEFVERQKFVDAQDTIGTTFFRWSAPLLVQHLHEVIATKSKKSFAEDSEPFAERHLVLCTDERMIDEPMARAAVESLPSTPHQFSGVWLILGPNHIGYHPYFRVH